MVELSAFSVVLLFLAAGVAGFVDSIAGGGGIITLPALLAVGVPPHFALGTNKLQASFGSLTAALNYRQGKLVRFRSLRWGIVFTALGAMTGAVAIQWISAAFLERAIPLLLVALFFYMVCNPQVGATHRPHRMTPPLFYVLFGCVIGYYDGFFGPGTGSFWTLAFVAWLGLDLRKATAHTKVLNFTSNLVALVAFLIGGHVLFTAGLIMGLGQVCGAWMGSHLVLRRGTRFVRIIFLCVVGATIARLLWSTYFQQHPETLNERYEAPAKRM